MLKPKQLVLLIIVLLLVMVAVYYSTGGNVLTCLIGCLVIVLYVMTDMFVAVRKGGESESRRAIFRKKRSLFRAVS